MRGGFGLNNGGILDSGRRNGACSRMLNSPLISAARTFWGFGGDVTVTACEELARRRRRMNTSPVSYKRHRFPAEIIAHAVWLSYRFPNPRIAGVTFH